METIKYNNLTITPIMKPMLCWDNDEDNATEQFILAKVDPSNYPWRGLEGHLGVGWKHAKPLPEIEITIKINGKESKLSDISEETLLKLRNLK